MKPSVVSLAGVDVPFSSGLKSTPVGCLMVCWSYDEFEVLKPNCLVKCVGGLIDRSHGGVLIRGKAL